MRESAVKRRALHKLLEGMEEESEEAEEEIQDSEYDGFYSDGNLSDEEDRALYRQLVVEPLFDVSHLPKTPTHDIWTKPAQ